MDGLRRGERGHLLTGTSGSFHTAESRPDAVHLAGIPCCVKGPAML